MLRIWWTQPRLSLVACLVYAAAYAGTVYVVEGPAGRSMAAAAIAALVAAAYRVVSLRLARAHESGATDAAFDRDVWQRRWCTPPLFGRSDLAADVALGLAPQDRQGDRIDGFGPADVKPPLFNALRAVEAARLAVPLNWRVQFAALATGALAPWLPWPGDFRLAAAGGLLLPLSATGLLTVAVDRHASLRLLRSGAVERVAQLRPRTLRDVLGDGFAVAALLLIAIFGMLILLAGISAWSTDRTHALVQFTGLGILVAAAASARYALRAVPLVRFPGPAVISAYVDQELRQSRLMLLFVMSGQLVLGVGTLMSSRDDFLGGLGPLLVVLVVTAQFAWRPDALGHGGRHRLPERLRRIQRRWGLVDVPPRSDDAMTSTGADVAPAAGGSAT